MLVDDNITNLTLGKNVLSEKYDVITLSSGEKLFKFLKRTLPDLILLDIEMPVMNGYEVMRQLKADAETKNIPVIFLTAKNDTGSELEGLTLGAVDYISKPFSPSLLLKRIERHLLLEDQKKELKEYNENLQEMVDRKTETVVTLQNAVLQTVAELVECRDDITGGHIERTQLYLRILVNAAFDAGLYLDEISQWKDDEFFFQSAQLHDVGKIAIRDNILMKPGKLTKEEFDEMKGHTTFGGKVIEKIGKSTQQKSFLHHAKVFAETHHERWDGTGYPNGLEGERIPLQGRLMAIADVYDALISDRPYKKAIPHDEAAAIIIAGKGSHFDPELVDIFIDAQQKFEQATQIADDEQNACKVQDELQSLLQMAQTKETEESVDG